MAIDVNARHVRAALTAVIVPADERIGALLGEFGAEGAVERIRAGEGPAYLATRLEDALYRSRYLLDDAARNGIRFIVPEDDEWPSALDDLDLCAPIGIWCRGHGNLAELSRQQVAVVGARAATAYGERVASEVASNAAASGVSVISGGAFGIDAAAHRGALAAGGPTVAVMAGGVDIPYPSAHTALLERVCESGAVISEAAPGTSVRKNFFLTRNRIIAALATDTVVVEAALRSGALNTSTWANALGRRVWGVPGPINSAASAGVNRAIADGTMHVMPDVRTVVGAIAPCPSLGDTERAIALVVGSGASTVDMICEWSGLPVTHVLPALTMLEMGGFVARDTEGWRAVRSVGT